MAASNVSPDEILKSGSEIPNASQQHPSGANVKSEEYEKLEIDLSVKCRGCFVEDPEMHYLFTVFDQELSLADILMQTSAFVCKEDDGFPPYLCTKCTTCLIDFFNFKIQYQKTEIYVRTLLGKPPTTSEVIAVKTEVVDQKECRVDDDVDEDDNQSTIEDVIPVDSVGDFDEEPFLPDINTIPGAISTICDVCNQDFKNADECETHMAKDHGKNPFNKYRLFRKTVTENERARIEARRKRKYLDADIKDEILNSLPGKFCKICKIKFEDEEFDAHYETHKIHVCEECDHRCVRKSDLQTHMQSVHNTVRKFDCSICDKSFKTKALERRHQVVHLNPRSYCCDICGQRFNCSGTLKTHIQLRHIGNRDFICPICGLAFPLKSTVEKHIMRHNKQRPPSFYCEICSSGFKDKSSLKRHHLVKHSDNFVRPECQFCGRSYCSATKLRYHIEKHHSGIPVVKKKRGPKSVKLEYSSSEPSESEESNASTRESIRSGPKVRNVSEDFYRTSRSYSYSYEKSKSNSEDEDTLSENSDTE